MRMAEGGGGIGRMKGKRRREHEIQYSKASRRTGNRGRLARDVHGELRRVMKQNRFKSVSTGCTKKVRKKGACEEGNKERKKGNDVSR